MVGPTTEDLESLNELIKFDHVYVKADNKKPNHAKPVVVSVPTTKEKEIDNTILSDIDQILENQNFVDIDAIMDTSVTNSVEIIAPSTDSVQSPESPICDDFFQTNEKSSSCSDSGYSDMSDVGSPKSDTSSVLGDDMWEESFTELFPTLL